MKIFANKNIFKKIVVVFLLITTMSFVRPSSVKAKDDDNAVGGTLMKPICDFLVVIGDGFSDIIHTVVLKQEEPLIRIQLSDNKWRIWATIGAAIAAIVVVLCIAFVTGGVAAAIVGHTVMTITAGVVKTALIGATVARCMCI